MSLSPLIVKYEKALARNPRSRVFAPLAQIYRKLGLLDKVQSILQDGIRYNPDYILGYVELANYYYELKQYQLAHATLRPLVATNRDNLKIQNLFADCCMEMGQYDEALDTYKYLLFLNPKNTKIAQIISNLERDKNLLEDESEPELLEQKVETFDVESFETSNHAHNDFSGWVEVDTSKKLEADSSEHHEMVNWTVESHVHEDKNDEETSVEEEVPTNVGPKINHALIDIYIQQGHLEKGREVLEQILKIQPDDQETIEKLDEVNGLIAQSRFELDEPSSNSIIREKYSSSPSLMDIYDRQIGFERKYKVEKVEKMLGNFTDALRSRSN